MIYRRKTLDADGHTDKHTDTHTHTRTLLLTEALPLSWARLKINNRPETVRRKRVLLLLCPPVGFISPLRNARHASTLVVI